MYPFFPKVKVFSFLTENDGLISGMCPRWSALVGDDQHINIATTIDYCVIYCNNVMRMHERGHAPPIPRVRIKLLTKMRKYFQITDKALSKLPKQISEPAEQCSCLSLSMTTKCVEKSNPADSKRKEKLNGTCSEKIC